MMATLLLLTTATKAHYHADKPYSTDALVEQLRVRTVRSCRIARDSKRHPGPGYSTYSYLS